MTYEQAGGGRAGLAIARKNEGDTLTLHERILHHYATSLATLETISSRSEKTVEEFIKYYGQSQKSPVGVFKSYIVKSKDYTGPNTALRELLQNQGIQYGVAGKNMSVRATDLATSQEENIKIEPDDIVISAYQPKSTLLKILFEPDPELEDSLTYDITSWGLTYALGLKAFGLKEKITPVSYRKTEAKQNRTEQPVYAYLANWNSFEDVKFLASLLQQKIKVRSSLTPFELDGKKYHAGALIITRKGNESFRTSLDNIIIKTADEFQVDIHPVSTGFVSSGFDLGSVQVQPIKPRKIVAVGGESVYPLALGEVWHFFEQQLRYPVTIADGKSLSGSIPWNEVDVLILPSGDYAQILDEKLLNSLREWVGNGGRLIVMENALNSFLGKPGFDLKRKKTDENKDQKNPLKTFASAEREYIRNEPLGSVFRVHLDTTHPLAFGYKDFYYALIQKSWNFEYLQDGWNVGYLKEQAKMSGFTGSKALVELKNTPVIASQDIGQGKVIYLATNPLFRGFWYGGKLLFGNALFR